MVYERMRPMSLRQIKEVILCKLRGEPNTETLKGMGLKVGDNFSRQGGCIIDYSHCWLITIGNNVTLAPGVCIMAHDASTKRHLGYTKIGKVCIGDNTFIGAGSIVLPNVKIGSNVIIGAGSVVVKDIPKDTVAVGNPARVICSLQDYLQKQKDAMKESNVYDKMFTINYNISDDMKEKMIYSLEDGIGFVE